MAAKSVPGRISRLSSWLPRAGSRAAPSGPPDGCVQVALRSRQRIAGTMGSLAGPPKGRPVGHTQATHGRSLIKLRRPRPTSADRNPISTREHRRRSEPAIESDGVPPPTAGASLRLGGSQAVAALKVFGACSNQPTIEPPSCLAEPRQPQASARATQKIRLPLGLAQS